MFKKIVYCLLLTSTLGLSSCATTALFEDFNPTEQETYKKVLGQDTMLAIGQSVNHGKKQGLVFIGQKYTYLITQGGEPFYALLREFPANKLVLVSDIPISLEFSNATQFQDKITFNYADPVEKLTPQQVIRLKQLGFEDWKTLTNNKGQTETYLQVTYAYQGQLYKPSETAQIHHRFSKPYPLSLIQEKSSTHINAGNIGKTIILTPLALTFDVVTAPITGTFALVCMAGRLPCF